MRLLNMIAAAAMTLALSACFTVPPGPAGPPGATGDTGARCCGSDYFPGMVSRGIVGADARGRGLGPRVAQCGTVVKCALSA
jgi:hypothetical protein